ncbi:hypothetical protein CTI12_AA513260 [Artemisia annua]|uniref:Reverse transcriptase zinc-binding domain-containing protein n=1 Tax=Artemisia annua TaxID=35608 RepID=A0A2U1LAA2_ARTAN|nr:hypothetical protein CTI12_AA513260 [Artemisia annua]
MGALDKYKSGIYLCPLCNTTQDSKFHFFSECAFSSQVWKKVLDLVENPVGGVLIHGNIVEVGEPVKLAHKHILLRVVIAKLLFGASVYYIWQGKNNRLLKKKSRRVEQVCDTTVHVNYKAKVNDHKVEEFVYG